MTPSHDLSRSFEIRTISDTFHYLDPGKFRVQLVPQASDDCKKLYNVMEISSKKKYSVETYDRNKHSAEAREQMLREIEAVQDLSHRNIPCLIEVQEQGNFTCLVTEKIPGKPLSAINEFRPLEVDEIFWILKELGDTVEYMHKEGNLGHGDINPSNVFLHNDGGQRQLTLIGFGHSRLDSTSVTLSSSVPGTPGFIPRNQICNPNLRAHADIHGMGMTAYCMLTGIPVEEVAKYIDLKTGKVTFPKRLHAKHWELKTWIRRCVAPNCQYPSANVAVKNLKWRRKLGELSLSDKPRIRCPVLGVAVFLIVLSGILLGRLFQQQRIVSLEEQQQRVLAEAERAYDEAMERVEIKQAEELKARKERNFTRLKQTNSCQGCDLSGMDLSGMDFSGADLRGADFTGSWLKNTNLEGADLTGAVLDGVDLENGNLRRANLTDSSLRGANFYGVSAVQACFVSADITGTSFRAADLENASFERANTQDAEFGFISTVRRGAIDATGEVWFGENTAPPACD